MLLRQPRQSILKRVLGELRESAKYLIFLTAFVTAMVTVLISSLMPQYEQIEDQIVALADSHLRYETIQPGWSFPGRIWSAPAPLDLPQEQLLAHARLRGYEEACPAVLPGPDCMPRLRA